MAVNRVKRKWMLVVRWISRMLLVQFILINVSAALYAYRLTHFYNDASLSVQNQKRNVFSKTWRIFTGPKYLKSQIVSRPGFPYEIIILKTTD